MKSFHETGIRLELQKAVKELGFELPLPVQQQVIPKILETTRDIIALSQTGSGKTAAYGLPLLSLLNESLKVPQILVLSPTRELCIQIANDMTDYSKYMVGLKTLAVYGGSSMEKQISQLKQGVHVVIATPGRINDLIRRKRINLGGITAVVLDEADEMLNMGFQEDLNTILDEVPESRRTLLFSATMPREVAAIASKYMKNAEEITVGHKNAGAENVSHNYYVVHASDRYLALKRIVDFYPDIYGIIFCRTRIETKDVAEKLMKDGYNADALHGDLSQQQRDYVMQRFRVRNLQILVATDVAARGLDVDDLSHVINYNLPDDDEIYTHRSGRTGRAGKSGISISILHIREKNRISMIEKKIRKKFEQKKVPGGSEICEKQLLNVIDRMKGVEVNESQIMSYMPAIMDKLGDLSREDIIAKFVSVEFNRFLDYYKTARDINVVTSREDSPRKKSSRNAAYQLFRINLGTMDGISVPRLIGFINECTRNPKIAIGRIDLQRKYSYFEADKSFEETIVKSFKNIEWEERAVVVTTYTAERPETTRGNRFGGGDFKRRSGGDSGSGYKGNRSSFEGGSRRSSFGGDRSSDYRSKSSNMGSFGGDRSSGGSGNRRDRKG